MNHRKNKTTDWFRSLVAALGAVAIVGGIVYALSNIIQNPSPPNRLAGNAAERPPEKPEPRADGAQIKRARKNAFANQPKPGGHGLSQPPGSESDRKQADGVAFLSKTFKGVDNNSRGRSGTRELVSGKESGEPESGAEPSDRDSAKSPSNSESRAGKTVASNNSNLAPAERTKVEGIWKRKLVEIHNGFHRKKGSEAVKRAARDKAESDFDAITDPLALPAIWAVLSANPEHHQLLCRTLERINAPAGTTMLAELSVYSPDEKVRHAAMIALAERDATDFAPALFSVFSQPLNSRIEPIQLPGQPPCRVLLVEGERMNLQLIYPTAVAPGAEMETRGVYTPERPYMTPQERRLAAELNREELDLAHAATEEQLKMEQEELARINERIRTMNERALDLLRRLTGRRFGPDREDWKKWLAESRGYPYAPPKEILKPTLAQVVPPLYNPTFIPIPTPT
jgi:hypothetical protein